MSVKIKKYGASWCSHCRLLDKEFQKNKPNCEIEYIDVDDLSDEEVNKLEIRSIPVVVLLQDDIEIAKWVSEVSVNDINKEISKLQC